MLGYLHGIGTGTPCQPCQNEHELKLSSSSDSQAAWRQQNLFPRNATGRTWSELTTKLSTVDPEVGEGALSIQLQLLSSYWSPRPKVGEAFAR